MQFLVLARVVEGVAMEQVLPHIKPEAQVVWKNYLADIVRSIHYITDMSGAVLWCEAPTLEAMQAVMAQFPMGKAGLVTFEILPLKPYFGYETLFEKSDS